MQRDELWKAKLLYYRNVAMAFTTALPTREYLKAAMALRPLIHWDQLPLLAQMWIIHTVRLDYAYRNATTRKLLLRLYNQGFAGLRLPASSECPRCDGTGVVKSGGRQWDCSRCQKTGRVTGRLFLVDPPQELVDAVK